MWGLSWHGNERDTLVLTVYCIYCSTILCTAAQHYAMHFAQHSNKKALNPTSSRIISVVFFLKLSEAGRSGVIGCHGDLRHGI